MRVNAVKFAAAAVVSAMSLFAGTAGASVLLNVDSPVAGQHTIVLDPATFTVTNSGSVGLIVFEDFFAADVGPFACGSAGATSLTVSINGGAAFAIGHNDCSGIFGSTFGLLDANDLFINVTTADEFAVTVGDIVTIGGSAVFGGALPSLNANFAQVGQLLGEFTCAGCALSGQTALTNAVPEPGSLALVGLALAGLGFSLRRKA